MNTSYQIAKHIREVYFGGNWTAVNLEDTLKDVDWKQATEKIYDLNTIAALVYHINYFVSAVLKVLQDEPLNASDKLSFNHPPINSKDDWDKLLEQSRAMANDFADLIEKLPDEKLEADFWENKYGNYYYNLQGIVEHIHYHLGQVVLIKKIIQQGTHN